MTGANHDAKRQQTSFRKKQLLFCFLSTIFDSITGVDDGRLADAHTIAEHRGGDASVVLDDDALPEIRVAHDDVGADDAVATDDRIDLVEKRGI